jgi:hypothetical protein
VIAGTCRNSRSASKRRCSSVLADQGSCVVHPTWLSISLMNCPILPAAAGLLALDAHQRGLLLLIGKVDVEHAVGDQRQAHHGDEQNDIFNKQPAAHDRSAGRGARRPRHSSIAAFRRRSHEHILAFSAHQGRAG